MVVVRELSEVETDVLVAMSAENTSWATTDLAALIAVPSAAAESALWALVELDLIEEIAPGPEDRYAGRWSVFRPTPYGIRLGYLLAREAAS